MAESGRGGLYGEIRKDGRELSSELQRNTEALTGTLSDSALEGGEKIVLFGEICAEEKSMQGAIRDDKRLAGNLPGTLVIYAAGDLPVYNGPYEVTPSDQEQTLPVNGKRLTQNIKVKKIPERYGLITYNQDKIITIT